MQLCNLFSDIQLIFTFTLQEFNSHPRNTNQFLSQRSNLGETEMVTSLVKRSGRVIEAITPIMVDTECYAPA